MNTPGNTRLVAVADVDPEKGKRSIANLKRQHGEKVDVVEEKIFGGLGGYKQAIDSGADLVVIATPPGFKPQQFDYAVRAGKHVFCEKPGASDAAGDDSENASDRVAFSPISLLLGAFQQGRPEILVGAAAELRDRCAAEFGPAVGDDRSQRRSGP